MLDGAARHIQVVYIKQNTHDGWLGVRRRLMGPCLARAARVRGGGLQSRGDYHFLALRLNHVLHHDNF